MLLNCLIGIGILLLLIDIILFTIKPFIQLKINKSSSDTLLSKEREKFIKIKNTNEIKSLLDETIEYECRALLKQNLMLGENVKALDIQKHIKSTSIGIFKYINQDTISNTMYTTEYWYHYITSGVTMTIASLTIQINDSTHK